MNPLALIKTQKYLSVMELACVAPGEEPQSYLLTSLLHIEGHGSDIPAQPGVTTSINMDRIRVFLAG